MPHIQQLAMQRYGDEHLAEAAVNLAEHHGTRQQIEAGKSVLPDLQDLAVAILHLYPQFKAWLKSREKTPAQPPTDVAPGSPRPPDEL
jgi:hypothetical protein